MTPINIQFGAGGNHLPGFVNHDNETPIQERLPYEDDCVDLVFAEHVAEHTGSHDILNFFTDVHRILKPGGVFRVCVPMLDDIATREHASDLVFGHGHLFVFAEGSLAGMLFAAGFDRDKIVRTGRKEIDSHWKVIGRAKDDIESLRMEATK